MCKGQDPAHLMTYPINKNEWIMRLKEFLNSVN